MYEVEHLRMGRVLRDKVTYDLSLRPSRECFINNENHMEKGKKDIGAKDKPTEDCVACFTNGSECIERDVLMYAVLRVVGGLGGDEMRKEFSERLLVELAKMKPAHNHF